MDERFSPRDYLNLRSVSGVVQVTSVNRQS
jgi:hypothetical protein